MATPLSSCTFECGADSINGHWFNNNGNTSIDATVFAPMGSAASLKVVCDGTVPSAAGRAHNWTATNNYVERFKFRISALPATNTEFYQVAHGTATLSVKLGFEASSGKLCIYPQNNYAGRVLGPVLVANTWIVIDVKVDGTAQTMDWSVGGMIGSNPGSVTPQPQLAIGGTAGTFLDGYYGQNDNGSVGYAAYTAWYDDSIVSVTLADYPIYMNHMKAFFPFADGAHSTGTAGNYKDAGGTNLTNATTTAWGFLDEVPATITDCVAAAAIAASNYMEVRFNCNTYTDVPMAVDFVTGWAAASAASAAGQIKMRDNLGATDDAILNTTIAVTTMVYGTKCYAARPAALGAWTLAAFNDLRARGLFCSDATPNIYWGGIMFEAAFPVTLPATLFGPAPLTQAVQRAAGGW